MRAFTRQKVPAPPDFRPLPLPQGTVDVEIGCGVGYHPLRYAASEPSRFLLAFERTSDKFARFQRRYETHGSPANLWPVHGDAIAWLAHGMPAGRVSRLFLLYPNPYPKESQKNLRWGHAPAAGLLHEVLAPEGEFVLRTNKREYADEVVSIWPELFGFAVTTDRALPAAENPITHFEKKYKERGETCWEIVLKKTLH